MVVFANSDTIHSNNIPENMLQNHLLKDHFIATHALLPSLFHESKRSMHDCALCLSCPTNGSFAAIYQQQMKNTRLPGDMGHFLVSLPALQAQALHFSFCRLQRGHLTTGTASWYANIIGPCDLTGCFFSNLFIEIYLHTQFAVR